MLLKLPRFLADRKPYFSKLSRGTEKTSAPTGALIYIAFFAIEVRIKDQLAVPNSITMKPPGVLSTFSGFIAHPASRRPALRRCVAARLSADRPEARHAGAALQPVAGQAFG
jgi:hypothetical protein